MGCVNYLTKIEFDLLLSNIDDVIRQLEQEILQDFREQGIDPGPYLSGEWNTGGNAQWETDKKTGERYIHFTDYDAETNIRTSWDENEGDVSGVHIRDQDTNQGLDEIPTDNRGRLLDELETEKED